MAAAAWYVRTDRRVPVALVLLTAAGVFLAVAKSQTFVFAVLVVPVLLLRTVPFGRWSGHWTGRLAPAVAALVLLGVSGSNLVQQPAFYTRVNIHNLVFRTLLPDSSDPAGALRQFGVSTRLVRYEYTGYFDRRPPASSPTPTTASSRRRCRGAPSSRFSPSTPATGCRCSGRVLAQPEPYGWDTCPTTSCGGRRRRSWRRGPT